MASMNFKAYLTDKESTLQEIRKFVIDKDVGANFEYLHEKLQTVFPGIRGKVFTVCWRDIDGDEITISSNEELKIALHEIQETELVYKIHVMVHSDFHGEKPLPIHAQGLVHEHVICDGCDSNVKGFRYKCMQCNDYDLCSQCEALGLHAEHTMIRIPSPMHWLPHCNRRLIYRIRKLLKKNDSYFGKDEAKDEKPMRGRGYHRGCGCNFETSAAKKGRTQDSGPSGPSAEASNQQEKDDDEECADFLSFPMEGLKQMLNNFGINFDVDFNVNKNQGTSQSAATANRHEPQEKTSEEGGAADKFPGEGKKLVDDKKDDKKDDKPVPSDAAPAANQNGSPTKPEIDEWTMVDRNEASSNSHSLSVASSINDASVKTTAPSAPEASPPQQTLYPPLPKEEEKVNHPNPKIRRAIETMISMGFSNKGGLLTYLLVAEDGNISKVLDLLQSTQMAS